MRIVLEFIHRFPWVILIAIITAFLALLIAKVNHLWSELSGRKLDCEKVAREINGRFEAFLTLEAKLRRLKTDKPSLYNNRYKPYLDSIDRLRLERTVIYGLFVVIVLLLPSLKAVAELVVAK